VLEAIRLPAGFAEAFAKALRAKTTPTHRPRDVEKQRNAIEARIARLQELFELGHIKRGEYVTRREALKADADALSTAVDKPEKVAESIGSLVDDWPLMDAGQKRQVLETIFADVSLEDGALVAATPRSGWIPYLEAVLGRAASFHGRRRRESNPR
jgi:hypothetical protein